MRRHARWSLSFGILIAAGVSGGCAQDAGPGDGEPVEPGSVAEGLRNCPPTNPDYPTCIPESDHCAGARGTLTANPPSINQGQSTTLQWAVSVPKDCAGQITLSSSPVGVSGTRTVAPSSSTPYQLRLNAKTLASVDVNVVLPPTVRIDGNTPEWRRLFLQAVGTPNTRVVLTSNVDLDMTGFESIPIVQGVTITSEAPPPVLVLGAASLTKSVIGFPPIFGQGPQRNAQNLGPRLYTTSRPRPLFIIRTNNENIFGDNVRLIGFRIQGPHFDTMEGSDNLERGIQINSATGVEINNMELSGWSGQAIYIEDPLERQTVPEAVRVHDSFMHNNQHVGGDGYGVETGPGGHALIERNVFDLNRHAIASSGASRSTYHASQNLVLKGGGVHAKWYEQYTHLFDVHGDDNCTPFGIGDSVWNCGNAGQQYSMFGNAFQYTNGNPVKLRGTPRGPASTLIYGNVFPQGSQGDAVVLNQGPTNISVGPNTLGVDTFGEYGVCDFDGDGKDDLFLATGVSWWYMSAAKMHWVYLSPNTERLSQVGLGDFNGDKRCDVFAINHGTNNWEISSGGSGAWTALPGNYPGIPMDQLRFGDFNGDHITDVFRRAPDGQWSAISPGHYGWTALQSSGFALEDLRFGDFDGNGITDVLSRAGGSWSVSWNGTSPWQKLASNLNDDIRNVHIADVDGLPGDDIVRYVTTGLTSGRWDISSGGKTGWTTLASYSWPNNSQNQQLFVAARARTFVGRFDVWGKADLLTIDPPELGRTSRIFSAGHSSFAPHGLYAY